MVLSGSPGVMRWGLHCTPATRETGESWTLWSVVFSDVFSVAFLPTPPAVAAAHQRQSGGLGHRAMRPMAGRPRGCPLPIAAGLGPGAGAACVFSLSRRGRLRLATELRLPRSAETRVPAREVPSPVSVCNKSVFKHFGVRVCHLLPRLLCVRACVSGTPATRSLAHGQSRRQK